LQGAIIPPCKGCIRFKYSPLLGFCFDDAGSSLSRFYALVMATLFF
jgi:hypothetical protein